MKRYVKWRKPRGGIINPSTGSRRSCMHCGRIAVHSAVRRNGPFSMDVWYCDEHAGVAKGNSQL